MDRVSAVRERERGTLSRGKWSERASAFGERNERASEQKVPREDSSTLAHATMISCQRKEGGRKRDELEKQKRASQNT